MIDHAIPIIPLPSDSSDIFREKNDHSSGMTLSERNKLSVSQRKLEKRIVRLTAQAITDFNMIEEGDKVLVAMSGGKDSYVLLDALKTLRARAPIRFDLIAVNVHQHIPQFPLESLKAQLAASGVPYHIEDQDTNAIIERLIPEGKNVCSLCARLRRGILYRVANELGCTKIALGHHMDDVVSTFLLNLFYGGRLKAMPPKLRSDDGKNIVIRPLEGDGKARQDPRLSACCQGHLRGRRKFEATRNQRTHPQLGPRISWSCLQHFYESAACISITFDG